MLPLPCLVWDPRVSIRKEWAGAHSSAVLWALAGGARGWGTCSGASQREELLLFGTTWVRGPLFPSHHPHSLRSRGVRWHSWGDGHRDPLPSSGAPSREWPLPCPARLALSHPTYGVVRLGPRMQKCLDPRSWPDWPSLLGWGWGVRRGTGSYCLASFLIDLALPRGLDLAFSLGPVT